MRVNNVQILANIEQSIIQCFLFCRLQEVGPTITSNEIEVQQQQHVALDFIVPDFIQPFPHKFNLGLEQAKKPTLKWATHYLKSSRSLKVFQLICIDFPFLTRLSYVDALVSCLDLAIEFVMWMYADDDEVYLRRHSLENVVQWHLEIQVIIMSTFLHNKNLQDNLEKCVMGYVLGDEYTKGFFEKVVALAVKKHVLEIGMHESQICKVAKTRGCIFI
jgi:hypothetical protein